jgi:hypothetical protein
MEKGEVKGYIKRPTTVRFELTRAKPNGLAIHRLNHSATSSLTHGPQLIYIES